MSLENDVIVSVSSKHIELLFHSLVSSNPKIRDFVDKVKFQTHKRMREGRGGIGAVDVGFR